MSKDIVIKVQRVPVEISEGVPVIGDDVVSADRFRDLLARGLNNYAVRIRKRMTNKHGNTYTKRERLEKQTMTRILKERSDTLNQAQWARLHKFCCPDYFVETVPKILLPPAEAKAALKKFKAESFGHTLDRWYAVENKMHYLELPKSIRTEADHVRIVIPEPQAQLDGHMVKGAAQLEARAKRIFGDWYVAPPKRKGAK